MRADMRAFWVVLGLAAFLSLPSAPAESAPGCGQRASGITAGAQAPAPDPSEIFGTAPAPRPTSGTVDCWECGGGPGSPGFQCSRHCWSFGWCVDQCYADATTCELNNCICLPC